MEKERDELRAEILKDLITSDKARVTTDYATFSRSKMDKWQYSPVIDKAAEKLELLKLREQRNGKAKLIEVDRLVVNLKKI